MHNYKYRDDYNRDNELYELSWKEKEIRAAVEEGDRIDPILKDVMKYRTTVKMRRRKMLKKRMFEAKQLRKERQALVRPNFWMQDSVRKKNSYFKLLTIFWDFLVFSNTSFGFLGSPEKLKLKVKKIHDPL